MTGLRTLNSYIYDWSIDMLALGKTETSPAVHDKGGNNEKWVCGHTFLFPLHTRIQYIFVSHFGCSS